MGAEELPIFPLGTVLFPEGPLPLRIFETRYVDMISRCMKQGSGFVVAAITAGDETNARGFHDIGTVARIRDFETLPDGLLEKDAACYDLSYGKAFAPFAAWAKGTRLLS